MLCCQLSYMRAHHMCISVVKLKTVFQNFHIVIRHACTLCIDSIVIQSVNQQVEFTNTSIYAFHYKSYSPTSTFIEEYLQHMRHTNIKYRSMKIISFEF